MGKNKKLMRPTEELKKNFEQMGKGEIIWDFRGSELDPEDIYLLLNRYEYLFGYLMHQYTLNMIVENSPSLEMECELQFKKMGTSGYCYIDEVDPKSFTISSKHDQRSWIALNLDLHQALAEVLNKRYRDANKKIAKLHKLLKK